MPPAGSLVVDLKPSAVVLWLHLLVLTAAAIYLIVINRSELALLWLVLGCGWLTFVPLSSRECQFAITGDRLWRRRRHHWQLMGTIHSAQLGAFWLKLDGGRFSIIWWFDQLTVSQWRRCRRRLNTASV